MPVTVVCSDNDFDTQGVNTPQQLEQLERQHQLAMADQLMTEVWWSAIALRLDIRGNCSAVAMFASTSMWYSKVTSRSATVYRSDPNCIVRDAQIGAGGRVLPFTHIDGAEVLSDAVVGPYARLRPGTVIGEQAKVGNFVEVKNTRVGKAAKANHLAILGDADIGDRSNVGAGTITCNYDGANKHRTTLGEGVFVGSNSTFVAPITIDSGGFVAAGSTVTEDVKANQLAVARGRQRNVDGWQRRRSRGLRLMCGIVAVAAQRDCTEILLEGCAGSNIAAMTPRVSP